ncbi:family 78 glycoside hydrolase catalytic domain [Niabella yanshanensis]|uniref:alpha-L-rhamnosidase n=1 Tax=Niabella yanshanensis TaxID=577386 RepID=A0ABZ0W7G7_9BACT|nr:family 78 glycoside hydrolase catalytic domain [Niabella yanshanensis]WQD38548.1 family 78 glycoside hydrolase catalytic domain [Niabella yanshanensis]
MLLLFFTGLRTSAQTLFPDQLRCELIENPLGLDIDKPSLSWRFKAVGKNRKQSSYEVIVSKDSLFRSGNIMWVSGKTPSSKNNLILYAGKPLSSFTRYFWKVRVYDQDGKPSPWSQNAWFETAALTESHWKGNWIGDGRKTPEQDADFYKDRAAPVFRKTFTLRKKVIAARLYIAGLGYYEASINGNKVGTEMLAPGWTSFDKTVLYRSMDITPMLKEGMNAAGVMLGNGWYNPLPLRMWGVHNLRERLAIGEPCLKAMIRISYSDGSKEEINTDQSWQTVGGPVLRNNVFLGEHYDARKRIDNWQGNQGIWATAKSAVIVTGPLGKLKAQLQPGVEVTRIVRPVKITEVKPGVYLADMGQNFAGVARIRLKAAAGTRVVLRYGEEVYKDGSLNGMTSVAGQVKNGNGGPGAPQVAWQEDSYIASGRGTETWNPRFTFHGFRYIEIKGWPGVPQPADIEGLRMSAAVEQTGSFECSNPMLNQLAQNIRWTFLSNLFSVQSDCPAREKFGYGGDMFCTTEAFCYNFDMANFYKKIIQDHEDAQRPLGGITETAPYMGIADAGPGDQSGPLGFQIGFAYAIKQVYDFYGDKRVVEKHYPALQKQIRFLADSAKNNLYDTDLSDHESLDEKPIAFTASCFYLSHVKLMNEFAVILGKTEDAIKYQNMSKNIEAAIIRKFYNPANGVFANGTQSAQFFGLWHNLVSKSAKDNALNAMKQAVAKKDHHLSTGIFGTKMLFDVLRNNNLNDLAYQIASQLDYPGWGHMIENGATTLWETWKYSDNTYSHNHPMFGSINEWFYRALLGINAAAPGFKKILIKPQPAGDLSYASGSYRSVAGEIKSSWKLEANVYSLNISIPPNTTADVWIRTAKGAVVTESGKDIRKLKTIEMRPGADGYTIVRVGSGDYQFQAR